MRADKGNAGNADSAEGAGAADRADSARNAANAGPSENTGDVDVLVLGGAAWTRSCTCRSCRSRTPTAT